MTLFFRPRLLSGFGSLFSLGAILLPAARAETESPVPPESQTAPVQERRVEAGDADDWHGTAELYGFAPLRATGTTTIQGFEADTDLNLGDILSKLMWATSARGSIE